MPSAKLHPDPYEPPKAGWDAAHKASKAKRDLGGRTMSRDLKSTPLPSLAVEALDEHIKTLPAIPTDDLQVQAFKTRYPVQATLFDSKGMGEMCDLIIKGLTLADIAEYHGLEPDFLYNCYHTDRFGIRKAFDKAALQCKLHHLSRVHDGAINYQSSTWFLERKFRDEYGKEQTVNVRPVGTPKKTTWDLGDGKLLEFN